MLKKIKIFDTTLRDGEQSPGCSMNLKEKLEVASQLEQLRVDTIEAGFAASSRGDFESIRAIAKMIKSASVASLSRALESDIDTAYNSIREAESPLIHIFLATSPIHMRYKLKASEDTVFEMAVNSVKYAKKLCENVEFSAEDASRSDKQFLAKVIAGVIKAGATTINIPDTVGYSNPLEMAEYILFLKNNVKGIENVDISVHCHDDLGLAVANTLSSIEAGATQAECTINGIGERAGNASLEEVVMNLHTRRDYYKKSCDVDTSRIYHASKLIQRITGVSVAPTKAIVGDNAFAHESGIHQHGVLANRSTYEIIRPCDIGLPQNKMVLGKHSGRHAFENRLSELGYSLEKDELDKAFIQFKELADKRKILTDGDLEAIAAMRLDEGIEKHYELESFEITSGSKITSHSKVYLKIDDIISGATRNGDGPIDAAYKAINAIVEKDIDLENYSIRSATEGEDALGEVIVKLKLGSKTVIGKGTDTDIIKASILAYINGVNRLWE